VATSGAHNDSLLFTARRQFDERIVGGTPRRCGRCLDFSVGALKLLLDDPAGPGMSGQTWRPERDFWYQIPYRATVPERVDNLLVPGGASRPITWRWARRASCRPAWRWASVARTAAMISLPEEVRPRELDTALLRGQLPKQGAVVDEAGIEALNR
jgi:hypothetical protein